LKYVKGFDTIRAIAVFIVLIGHWGFPLFKNSAFSLVIDNLVQFGRFGVTIFFVLSGFLITSILLNEKNKSRTSSHLISVKNFFARRILRIFPIYYLLLFIVYFCNDAFVRDHFWYYATYTSNLLRNTKDISLPHFWSLAVEEQFYIIWPWLIFYVKDKYLKYVFLLFIVLGNVSQYISFYKLNLPYGYFSINCFDSFGIGALYSYIRIDSKKSREFEKSFIILFPFTLFVAWKIMPISGQPLMVLFNRFVDNIIALAMIMFALNNKTEWVKKYILENRVLNFLGKISYGIYLYHYTFGFAYFHFIDYLSPRLPISIGKIISNDYVFYFTKTGCLILVCWLSFKFIEQPIIKLKRKFEYT
jgi:peptidoglycan/LPS O-acetylase OafA/YrhL